MKPQEFNSIRTRDDSEWLARISKARAERRAKGLDDLGLGWDEIIEAERREREIVVAALWEQIIRQRKYLLTKIQVQIVRSGLQLIALTRNRENALSMMGYRRQAVRHLGREGDIHHLKIPLPESIGNIEIQMLRLKPNIVSLKIQVPAGVTVELSGKYYRSPRKVTSNEGTQVTYPELRADEYNVSIVWEVRNQTWEIPLTVEKAQ